MANSLVLATLRAYRDETTLHGIKYFQGKSLGTLLAAIAVPTGFVLLIYLAVGAICAYLQYNVATSVSFKQSMQGQKLNAIDFPAITFCADNILMSDFIGYGPQYFMLPFYISFENLKYSVYDASRMCIGKTSLRADLLNAGGLGTFVETFGQAYLSSQGGHNSINSVLGCTWQGRSINCSDLFLNRFTDYAWCFTFYPSAKFVESFTLLSPNTNYSLLLNKSYCIPQLKNGSVPPDCLDFVNASSKVYKAQAYGTSPQQIGNYNLSTTFAGPRSGASFLLSVQPDQYCSSNQQQSAGFTSVVHDREVAPIMYPAPGIELAPGFAIDVAITLVNFERNTENLGKCVSNMSLQWYKLLTTYSQEACLTQCLSQVFENSCGCIPAYAPPEWLGSTSRSSPVCTHNLTTIACYLDIQTGSNLAKYNLSQYRTYWGLTQMCNCPQQCTEKKYYVETSFTQLQSPRAYATMLPPGSARANFANMTTSEFREGYLLVNYYMKQLEYMVVYEQQAISFNALGNALGGALGVCLGGSIMTLVEFLLIFYYLIGGLVGKRRGRRIEPYRSFLANGRRLSDEAPAIGMRLRLDTVSSV